MKIVFVNCLGTANPQNHTPQKVGTMCVTLTFDPSVFDTGSHSEEDLSQFIVAGRAGQG